MTKLPINIYNFLLTILAPIIKLFLKVKLGKMEYEARINPNLNNRFRIWIHAASVGEVNAVKPLIKELLKKYDSILLTTMTTTGLKTAAAISDDLTVSLIPLDLPFLMKRFYRQIRPQIVILVETEFWPNMLLQAKKQNIPVVIVNGRISEKSLPNYRKTLFFWKYLWEAVKSVAAQSEQDKIRFEELGFQKVQNAHNLKFCLQLPAHQNSRNFFHLSANDFVITFGSSRPGEEKLLLEAIRNLQIENLKILIAPRHLKRIEEIKSIFSTQDYALLSENESAKFTIIDRMGILTKAYAVSDIAIVGGSFFDFGGHNPLEPAFYAKPILMGKFHSSCQASVSELQKNNAIIITENLQKSIEQIYNDKAKLHELGKNAQATLEQNKSSLENNLAMISNFLD